MRTWNRFSLALVLAGTVAAAASAQTQTADQTQPQAGASTAAPVTTVNEAIDRIIAREHDEIAVIHRYSPIVDTYVQDMKADPDMGSCLFAITTISARLAFRAALSTTRCWIRKRRARPKR